MADEIRVDEMDINPEEKKVLIKALTDKRFRQELERQVEGTAELSDDDLSRVVGGLTAALDPTRLRTVLATARSLELRINQGAQVLCSCGGCGVA